MVTKINTVSNTKITFKILVLNYVYADKHTEYTNIYKQCTVYTVHFHLHKPVKAEILNPATGVNIQTFSSISVGAIFLWRTSNTNQNLK